MLAEPTAMLLYLQLFAAPVSLSPFFTNVFPLMALGFTISLLLTALMYMAGNALQSTEILANAKDNLSNLAFSALLVLLFFGMFGILSQIASSIACGSSCDFLQAAHSSILLMRAKLMSIYFNLYFYEIIFGFLSTMGFSIPLSTIPFLETIITIPSLSFSPLSGLTPLSNAHTVVVEAVGSGLMLVIARQLILEFIMNYMFIFFVLGAAMRSISFTRRTGSSILALSATAYFVYPLAVLLSNYLVFQAYEPTSFGVIPTTIGYCDDYATLETLSNRFVEEREHLYDAEVPVDESSWFSFWDSIVSGAKHIGQSVWMLLKMMYSFNTNLLFFLVFSPVAFSTFIDFLFIEIQAQVQFLVMVFVAFFIEIIVTITMYRGAAMLVEGETEIFGISKLM